MPRGPHTQNRRVTSRWPGLAVVIALVALTGCSGSKTRCEELQAEYEQALSDTSPTGPAFERCDSCKRSTTKPGNSTAYWSIPSRLLVAWALAFGLADRKAQNCGR